MSPPKEHATRDDEAMKEISERLAELASDVDEKYQNNPEARKLAFREGLYDLLNLSETERIQADESMGK